MKKKIYFLALIFLILDIAAKYFAIKYVDNIVIIPNFFNLYLVFNEGIAFSLLQGSRILVIILTIIFLIYMEKEIIKKVNNKLELYATSLILGGVLGNLLDRIFYKKVVDFLSFKILGYNFPVFNLADVFICLGAFLYIIVIIKGDKMKVVVDQDKVRIDKFLSERTEYSRSKIQKMIEDEKILVNNNKISSNYKVKLDDEIFLDEEEEIEITDEKEDMNLDIVYEDEYLAIINKPSGIVTHPAVGNKNHTLVNGLLYHFNKISNKDSIRPGIVHRLDKDTSGLMVVAKDDITHEKLAELIKNKEVERKYYALVWGVVRHDKGTIDAPIGRDINDRQKYTVTNINGKPSITHFKVIKRYKDVTLLECKLETGRTHQIRVHMNYINHPVVNDPVYGKRKKINEYGQMLHSRSIKFIHPITNKELSFEKDVDGKFKEILNMFED